MNKKQFVSSVRALGIPEPTREQWVQMWEIYQRNDSYSPGIIVLMVSGNRIVDNRRIPERYKRDVLPLEDIAKFGAQMFEKLKRV